MQPVTIGIDVGKNLFHVHGVDHRGKRCLRKKLTRGQLPELIAQLPSCLIGMEACSGALRANLL